MSESIESSWLRKLRYTPLRDLFRLRLSGRLDVKHVIRSADLPNDAKLLIHLTTRRSRLWMNEKIDVAKELIAHFTDGLESGESIGHLIQQFGSEKTAAKLIRRAKIRQRPLIWHAFRWFGRGVMAVVAFYLFLTAWFYLTHPSPKVDYVAEINRPLAGVPESDLAWPLYRKVILNITTPRKVDLHPDTRDFPTWIGLQDNPKYWPPIQEWLTTHAADVETIRQAASKPVYGFVIGIDGSANDPQLWPTLSVNYRNTYPQSPYLGSILSPHLEYMRDMANILDADLRLAVMQNDGDRVERNISAMLGMAVQMRRKEDDLMTQLVGMGIDFMGIKALSEVLESHPQLLSDAQLTAIAHRISGPKVPADLISYYRERKLFYDAVQHIYTDDGHGDGHITADGLKMMFLLGPTNGRQRDSRLLAVGPGMMLMSASRKELVETYDRLMDRQEADLRRPLREVDYGWQDRELKTIAASTTASLRYSMLLMLLPPLQGSRMWAEADLGNRDGVIVGIALELYHRKHGAYPQSLDNLVPGFLPSLPEDRITGGPVKYRLIDSKPVVYSAGNDRDDDGGRLPEHPDTYSPSSRNHRASIFGPTFPAPDGDWILFPQPLDPPATPQP